MWLPGLVKVSNRFAPPAFLSSPSQSAVSDTPFALELLTNQPCTITIIGGSDAALFDIGSDGTGAVSLPTGTYNITIRITSNATGAYIDVPLTITAAAAVTLYDFALDDSAISTGDANGTAVGSLVSSGSAFPAEFSLSANTISANATNGTVVGELV
jgi:hypothetical protein